MLTARRIRPARILVSVINLSRINIINILKEILNEVKDNGIRREIVVVAAAEADGYTHLAKPAAQSLIRSIQSESDLTIRQDCHQGNQAAQEDAVTKGKHDQLLHTDVRHPLQAN